MHPFMLHTLHVYSPESVVTKSSRTIAHCVYRATPNSRWGGETPFLDHVIFGNGLPNNNNSSYIIIVNLKLSKNCHCVS